MQTDLDRIPPNDPETERAALCLMRASELAATELTDALDPDDFHDKRHAALFRVLSDMARRGDALDLPAVGAAMESAGLDRRLLAEVMEARPSVLSLGAYTERLKALRFKRAVLIKMQGVWTALEGADFQDRVGELKAALEKAPDAPEHGKSIGELLADPELLNPVPRVQTRLADLDRGLQGGLVAGLYILAAGPGGGKSTTVRTIARRASLHGTQTALVTLEDSREQAVRKIWAAQASVGLDRLENKRFQPAEAARLKRASAELSAAPLTIADGPNDLGRLESYLLGLSRRGVKLACIDQLSWIGAPGETAMERAAGISRRLRMLATRAGLAIVLCVQLNREGCKRESGPTLFDLRDAGNLEQDADGVLLVKAVEPGEREDDPAVLTLEVAKHRHGPQGPDVLIRLTWVKSEARIESYIPDFMPDEPRSEQGEMFRAPEAVGATRGAAHE
jgi:replicative DNA helicase